MNWEVFDLVNIAIDQGYKSIWIVYQATRRNIPISLDDIKEIGEIYGHKPRWALYTAQQFEIFPFNFTERRRQHEKKVALECLYNHNMMTERNMSMSSVTAVEHSRRRSY